MQVFTLSSTAAGLYWTRDALLRDVFKNSEIIKSKNFKPSAEIKNQIEKELGYTLPKDEYTFYYGQTGSNIDGYMIIDEQCGQHLPITFANVLTPGGIVTRHELMVYREKYGEEVKNKKFRNQFIGKSSQDPIRLGKDIIAVSGATISSRALSIGTRRAIVLTNALLLQNSTPSHLF